MIYNAKDFKNRKELDIAIRKKPLKKNDKIRGTEQQLSDLGLNESCTVYGVKVEVK